MTTPVDVFEALRSDFFRYYGTPYRLRYSKIEKEREALLDREGATWREPWIEPVVEYQLTGSGLENAVLEVGGDEDLPAFARCGLIEYDDIFRHQAASLGAARSGKNVVITAGTGSGKTESFLLPVIDALLRESRHWSGTSPDGEPWWAIKNARYTPQRKGESGRLPGIRALILYPMNALVEDQLVRLRRTLDSEAARRWLRTNRNGHRFFFGRYTGATPVSGRRAGSNKVTDLKRVLSDAGERFDVWRDDEDKRYFLQSLDGAEMRCRWDMQSHAPDILITNYSMLNIMLLREIEDDIFEQTRLWLESDPSNVFHLVVDELHMYRGTSGTEVAFLVRNLLNRLGLHPDSSQVRFIATSASLGSDDSGRSYLSQFFGASPSSFELLEGERIRPSDPPASLEEYGEVFTAWGAGHEPIDKNDAYAVLRNSRAKDAFVAAAERASDLSGQTVPLSTLDRELFGGEPTPGSASEPMLGLLRAVQAAFESGGPDREGFIPRLRTHLFLRNILGVWACSDPQCADADKSDQRGGVGKLWDRPRHRCSCGARVLRLLYCQSCGDLFLQGFLAPEIREAERFADSDRFLVAELGDLDAVPDQARVEESALNSALYWPSAGDRERIPEPWRYKAGSSEYEFRFRAASYEPNTGRLTHVGDGPHTGWTFEVLRLSGDEDHRDRIPALPIKCPHCEADWEMFASGKRARPITDKSRTRSSIRRMGTGYEKIGQVLVNALIRELRAAPDGQPNDEARRIVLFSDSRQDAAKLSAGLEKRHYQDLVRELTVSTLADVELVDLDLVRAFIAGDTSDAASAARRALRGSHRDLLDALEDEAEGVERAPERVARLAAEYLAGVSATQLASEISLRLASLGINPAGPDPSMQGFRKQGGLDPVAWTDLYDWSAGSVKPRLTLEPREQELRTKIDSALQRECMLNIFAGNGRDLESLGLATATVPVDAGIGCHGIPTDSFARVVRASVRILGDSRRIQDVRGPVKKPPQDLRTYWASVADHYGCSPEQVSGACLRALESQGGVREFLLQAKSLSLTWLGNRMAYECLRCARVHADDAGGICTRCGSVLPDLPNFDFEKSSDYYAFRAAQNDPFRMRCEELTGQTDRQEAATRQAYFQDVFLGDEDPRTSGVDLLSVTTTMEAGVDIGSLRSVVMSNMPPQRFNYQQRVGRAGRRRDPFSFALTLCRDRTHDEYYFSHPNRITNETPPAPYLDMDRFEIVQRTASMEALRQAFRSVAISDDEFQTSNNTHGEFGLVDAWAEVRPAVASELDASRSTIAAAVDALLVSCSEALIGRRDELVSFLCDGGLVGAVDAAVRESPPTQPDLSQHLAERGVLPMFGFPTRVRYLYTSRPWSTTNWPPSRVIDRQLNLAATEFAPGSELVKDKRVHTAIGIVGYKPRGREVVTIDNPFGESHKIASCRHCGSVRRVEEIGARSTCEVCGEGGAGIYMEMLLSEPAGFRTDFWPEDFEGSFTRSARGSTPRIAPSTDLTRAEAEGAVAFSGIADVFVINDNGGRKYRFSPVVGGDDQDLGSWISVDMHRDGLKRNINIAKKPEEFWEGAIGVVNRTDALLVGLRRPRKGLSLLPYDAGTRGAWYSLGFILRASAARLLDVGLTELQVGLSVRHLPEVGDGEHVEVFLADSLENGAGYATWLGAQSNLPGFIGEAQSFTDELTKPDHVCDSSCPDCIRDFTNLIFHPLLDWRLGRDLVRLLSDDQIDFADWHETEKLNAESFAEAFGGELVELAGDVFAVQTAGRLIVVHHPLEATGIGDNLVLTSRLDEAVADAEDRLGSLESVSFRSSFDLSRRLGWVAAGLDVSTSYF